MVSALKESLSDEEVELHFSIFIKLYIFPCSPACFSSPIQPFSKVGTKLL